jgi:hypothetical protein
MRNCRCMYKGLEGIVGQRRINFNFIYKTFGRRMKY